MWPFKSKTVKKLPNVDTAKKDVMNAIQRRLVDACPIPTCICRDCPSRGKCVVESDMKSSGACIMEGGPRITACSRHKALKGEFDDGEKETRGTTGGESTTNIRGAHDGGDLWCIEEVPIVRG